MSDDPTATRRALLRAATAVTAAGAAGCTSISTPADLASETEIRGNVDYFVGTGWLADHRSSVRVVDARPVDAFRRARIFGAINVPIDRVSTQRSSETGLVPDVTAFAETFAEAGLGRDEPVVVYGSSVGSRVTRIVYALHVAGHRGAVHVLNGGFEAWNGRVGTGPSNPPSPGSYGAEPRSDAWVDREWLADAVGTFNEDGPGLIDVRAPEAYLAARGSDALDPTHERHGHLPGAINVHWIGNVDGRRLADPGDLFGRYGTEAGLDTDGPTVVYGDDNVNPTHTWVVLRSIGFEDVRLYEGGFGEWANVDGDRGRYPVETKTNVVVESDGTLGGSDRGGDFSCTG